MDSISQLHILGHLNKQDLRYAMKYPARRKVGEKTETQTAVAYTAMASREVWPIKAYCSLSQTESFGRQKAMADLDH